MHILKVTHANTVVTKSLGLLGSKKAHPLYLQTRFGIHTFFMQFPIDVLILDERNSVVKLCKNLQPNRIFVWNPRFDNVVELPAGEIDKKKIKIGDTVTLQ